MTHTGSLGWFARHELRLAWRDWIWLLSGGRHRRARRALFGFALFALFMHGFAFSMVARYAQIGAALDKTALVVITGSALLSWSVMLSQAIESVTRAFYARADLDLILSSPVAARRLFSVRIAAMALSIAVMAALLAAPFIDVLALRGGGRWLAAYGAVIAMGLSAGAIAVALTVALFRMIGPKRTRLVAQIVAAVIGAAFVIGLQIAAIMSYGTLSRVAILQSDWLVERAPDPGSILWWPARAMTGDTGALAVLLAVSLLLLGAAILVFSPRFAQHAAAAAAVAHVRVRHSSGPRRFRRTTPMRALRRKEWLLLRRDPWLVSQTLMQLLYLVPPAVLLWRSFGEASDAPMLLVPVLVMAAGQLAGGLAWLAISGEDAPDLVATTPIPAGRVLRAKIEALTGVIALVFAPLLAALALAAPRAALAAAPTITLAAASATAIQLAFRSQARRSHFRRRQTSSRIATFAEAFSSIGWAATGALAALGSWLALLTGLLAVATVMGARKVAPSGS